MNNKLFIPICLILFIIGCKPSSDNTLINEENSALKSTYTVTDVLDHAEEYIGKEVTLKGMVEHVCSHSGKRCFIADSLNSIRVEATGNILAFDKELSGTEILVKGILREKQLDEKYINDWECQTKEKMAASEANTDHCNAEMAEIQKMREWMKEKNKNYFSVWFVDGVEYEKVNL